MAVRVQNVLCSVRIWSQKVSYSLQSIMFSAKFLQSIAASMCLIMIGKSLGVCIYFGKTSCEHNQCEERPYFKHYCLDHRPDVPWDTIVGSDYYCCDYFDELTDN